MMTAPHRTTFSVPGNPLGNPPAWRATARAIALRYGIDLNGAPYQVDTVAVVAAPASMSAAQRTSLAGREVGDDEAAARAWLAVAEALAPERGEPRAKAGSARAVYGMTQRMLVTVARPMAVEQS